MSVVFAAGLVCLAIIGLLALATVVGAAIA